MSDQTPVQGDDRRAVPVSMDISALIFDPRFQMRAETNQDAVDEYVEAIRRAESYPFPPIEIVSRFVVDGFHRGLAVKRVLDDPETPAELRRTLRAIPCLSVEVDLAKDDVRAIALLRALAANQQHGLRRTRADVRRAILLTMETWPELTDREIARRTGASPTTVGTVRRQLSAPVSNLDTCEASDEPAIATPAELIDAMPWSPVSNLDTCSESDEHPPRPSTVEGPLPTEQRAEVAAQPIAHKPEANAALNGQSRPRPAMAVAVRRRSETTPLRGLIERAQASLADLNKACSKASRDGHVGTEADRHEIRYHLKKVDAKLADWMNQAEGLPR